MIVKEDWGKIVSFFAIWHEQQGPRVVDKFPKDIPFDLDETTAQIFQSLQTVFGNNPNIKFDRTNLNLPLKSLKRMAKILVDSVPSTITRGGFLPFISVFLFPIEFPEEKLARFNEIQGNILGNYITDKKVALQKSYDEIITLTDVISNELRDQGITAFKEKDYKKASNNLFIALKLMAILGKEDKYNKYLVDLNKARMKRSQELASKALEGVKNNQIDAALELAIQAQEIAERTHINKFINEIEKSISNIYKKSVDLMYKTGGDALNQHLWKNGEKIYQQSLDIATQSQNKALIKDSRKKMANYLSKWALSLAEDAKRAVKAHNIKDANAYYDDALKLAKRANNISLQKKFEKQLGTLIE